MLCNKSDHKKHGFVLVLYLFRDITSFKSEKGDTAKFLSAGFIHKQTSTAAVDHRHLKVEVAN